MFEKKSMIANGILNGISTIVGMLAPLVIFPYILRTLGTESYGKVVFGQTLISYFVMFATLGISDFAQRECAIIQEMIKHYLAFV